MNHKITIKILRLAQDNETMLPDNISKKLNIKLETARFHLSYAIEKNLINKNHVDGKPGIGYYVTFAGLDYLEEHSLKTKARRYYDLIITGTVSGLIVLVVGYYLALIKQ